MERQGNIMTSLSPVFVLVKQRPLDVQQAGQDVDEDLPDPGGHLVGLGTPEVNVEDEDCDTYAGQSSVRIIQYRYDNLIIKL